MPNKKSKILKKLHKLTNLDLLNIKKRILVSLKVYWDSSEESKETNENLNEK